MGLILTTFFSQLGTLAQGSLPNSSCGPVFLTGLSASRHSHSIPALPPHHSGKSLSNRIVHSHTSSSSNLTGAPRLQGKTKLLCHASSKLCGHLGASYICSSVNTGCFSLPSCVCTHRPPAQKALLSSLQLSLRPVTH